MKEYLQVLKGVWCKNIRADFEEGRIVTERELQCCLYHHLKTALSDIRTRLLIEHSIQAEDRRVPDIVIAAPDLQDPSIYRVSLFLELKVGKYPKFADELGRIATRGPGTSFVVRRRRLDGGTTSTTLVSDESTQFALGFLAAGDAKAVYAKEMIANDGGAFGGQHPQLAAKTTLLYGRIHPNRTSDFGVEPLLAESD